MTEKVKFVGDIFNEVEKGNLDTVINYVEIQKGDLNQKRWFKSKKVI